MPELASTSCMMMIHRGNEACIVVEVIIMISVVIFALSGVCAMSLELHHLTFIAPAARRINSAKGNCARAINGDDGRTHLLNFRWQSGP